MKKQEPKDWQCQECGRLMTLKRAEEAVYGTEGCPGCGGTDIDQRTDEGATS